MRYIDSGSRNANDALGTWLGSELIGGAPLAALRVQSGFFSSQALGYFEETLSALREIDGHTRFLVGSNDGQTPRDDIADLLGVAGPPRAGMRVGVVSFQTGYFHPKVFHILRSDGSSAAYVGSANLTGAGVAALHIEAGLIIDSNTGDSAQVLDSIAAAVDAWFIADRPGLFVVSDNADLDPLVQGNVLGVEANHAQRTVKLPGVSEIGIISSGHSLHTLVSVPPLQTPQSSSEAKDAGNSADGPTEASSLSLAPPDQPSTAPASGSLTQQWGKALSRSDAGRKPGAGAHERGSIPLSQGDLRGQIDQRTYFRNQLFGQLVWNTDVTKTNKPIESTRARMHVTIAGTYYGLIEFKISNEPERLQGTRNLPTAQLHAEPISDILKAVDVQGMHLAIELDVKGDYQLSIE